MNAGDLGLVAGDLKRTGLKVEVERPVGVEPIRSERQASHCGRSCRVGCIGRMDKVWHEQRGLVVAKPDIIHIGGLIPERSEMSAATAPVGAHPARSVILDGERIVVAVARPVILARPSGVSRWVVIA